MPPRRDRVVLWCFALLVLAWMVAQALTGAETGLLYVAPALVLALPLLVGRYPGEERIAAFVARSDGRGVRASKQLVATQTFVRLMQRGGRLVASSLAKRPPPPPASFVFT